MVKVSILITGIGGGGFGEQILKALYLSKKYELNLIGTDIIEDSAGKQLCDIFKRVPPVYNENYSVEINALIKKYNIRYIFPGSEPELFYFSNNRESFIERNIHLAINSQEIIDICSNKYLTYKKIEALGIKLPNYLKIDSIDDLSKMDYFPVVLKPNTSSGGSSNVFIATDADEVQLLGSYMLRRGVDLIAQEYFGSSNQEYTIGVSSDINGKVLGSVIIKRDISNALSIRQKVKNANNTYVISSGLSQGKVVKDESIQKKAELIAEKLNSKGPINIQCRYVNNELYIFEINPRLSGTTNIRALAGYNEPEMMIGLNLFDDKWLFDIKEIVVMRSLKEVVI